MAFRLYTSSTSGGAAAWNSGTQTISVTSGLFRILLQPTGLDWENPLFIEVEVDGVTLSPREEIIPSAFAVNAGSLSGKSYTSAATAPSSPSLGDLWIGTGNGALHFWNGSQWDQLGSVSTGAISNIHIASNAGIALSKLEKNPSTVGTINTSTNPVDWSQLKNVPASIADGLDNTGGGGAAVLEEGVVVEAAATNINFADPYFNVTSGPSGTANISVDGSSITLQGNLVNGASQLVRLNASSQLPAVSGVNLTNLTAANLTGLILNSSIDNSSVTKQGNIFNGANGLVQLNSLGALPSTIMVSSIAANAVQDLSVASLSSGKLTGLVPSSLIDSSSITKQGNVFNAAGGLVQLDSLGALPYSIVVSSISVGAVKDSAIDSLTAAKLTGLVPNNAIDASSVTKQGNVLNAANGLVQLNSLGALPSTIMVSSIAANAVQDLSIASLSSSKLTGLVSNSLIDSSSVTKQGNIFNAAGGLVQLNSLGALPSTIVVSSIAVGAVKDSAISSLTASKLTGLVPNTSIDTSSFTAMGNSFNGVGQLIKLDTLGRLVIGGGTPISAHFSTTTILDFDGLGALSCDDIDVTVTGARDGDSVSLGVKKNLASIGLTFFTGFVKSDDTVTVRRCSLINLLLSNPAAETVRIDVWRH